MAFWLYAPASPLSAVISRHAATPGRGFSLSFSGIRYRLSTVLSVLNTRPTSFCNA